MKNQKLKRIVVALRTQTKALKKSAHSNYVGLLLALCDHHSHLPFVQSYREFITRKDWTGLVRLADSLSESEYTDATEHFVANQFASLVRKFPFSSDLVKAEPESKAAETFLKSERKCSRMNRVFHLLDRRSPNEIILAKVRSFIQYTIGSSPDINQVYSECGFGGGASVGVHGRATNIGRKISATWTVSPGAFMHGYNAVMDHSQLRGIFFPKQDGFYCFDSDAAFSSYKKKIACVTYNKISFVPKTVWTARTIAVEPIVNGYLQKGVDQYLRQKLKRVNINLQDQTRNQEWARKGSLDDSEEGFVTIDLKSASDSISIGLAKNLLPEDWFYLLDNLRSKEFLLNGKKYPYQKFCSMGNGFCFPLETLIFVAVCSACGCGLPGTDFTVYGDDIIVRKKHASCVIKILSKLGFSTNKAKTFLKGPFRESCGADWFGGLNVRPFTLDFRLDSVESIFKILNISKERSSTEDFFKPVRQFLFSLLDVGTRLVRPFKGNHDSGIDGYNDEYLASSNAHFDPLKQHWVWFELAHRPVADDAPVDAGVDDESIWMYTLLSGSRSSHSRRHPVELNLRRETKTKVILTGHGGSTSTWTPPVR